jgi:hypothetical protein
MGSLPWATLRSPVRLHAAPVLNGVTPLGNSTLAGAVTLCTGPRWGHTPGQLYARRCDSALVLDGVTPLGAARDASHATPSAQVCTLVELLPTAASLGSALRASIRSALVGRVDERGTRAAPHAGYGATLCYTHSRSRRAIDRPTARLALGLHRSPTASLIRYAHGPHRTSPTRRPRDFAHAPSCCRPPRGWRRAALFVLWHGALSTDAS